MQDDASDESLMLRYGAGEVAAFEQLYARYKAPLYRFLLRQLQRDAALTDELFQDIWMRIIHTRQRYTVQARFRTYLYHLARNRLIDHNRASGRRPIVATDCPDSRPATPLWQPDVQADNAQLQALLLRHIEALPEAQREVFLLKEEAGLSLDEIADITQVKRETVKSRLRYALDKLRTALTEQGVTLHTG